MIYSYSSLASTLRAHCDNAEHRIWICSPFIGGEKDILRIIGGSWRRSDIDFKVITDIETGFIRQDTFDEFNSNHPRSIKSLKGLHAKVYIVDDWCLVSSANLTGTAFSKRYEIGTDDVSVIDVESFYNALWDNKKSEVIESWRKGKKQSQIEFEDGPVSYDRLTNLPAYSAETDKMDKTDKYLARCSRYIDFANIYSEVTGRCQDMASDGFTLLQEVDYLFNYLEHVCEACVSKDLNEVKPRKKSSQRALIKKYFKEISLYYKQDRENARRRVESADLVKELTAPSRIMALSKEEVRKVLDTFNCFGLGTDMHGHASKFIEENKLDEIRLHWDNLLNKGDITDAKVKECCELRHCGDSSVSELIAWRFPDKYPIMNTCSKKGLWFFGIEG